MEAAGKPYAYQASRSLGFAVHLRLTPELRQALCAAQAKGEPISFRLGEKNQKEVRGRPPNSATKRRGREAGSYGLPQTALSCVCSVSICSAHALYARAICSSGMIVVHSGPRDCSELTHSSAGT